MKHTARRRLWKDMFAQPAGDFYRRPMLHILCNRGMEVEGCRAVEEFEDGRLTLDMGQWRLIFYGEGLQIREMNGGRLLIRGILLRIEFSGR